jgi:tetratricopeptide (TPR) repeat protein
MSISLSRCLIYSVLLFGIAPWPLHSAACDDPLARLVSVEGQVQRSDCGTQGWCDADLFMPICDGQSVRTGADSRAAVQLVADESVLRLDQRTTLLIKATDPVSRGLLLDLVEGAMNLFSRTRRSLSIELPFMALAIKGTEFQVRAFESKSRIDLFDGVVEASNSQGSLTLHAGQSALAVAGEPPRLMALVDPIDAVQWSFYYTPLIAALAVADDDQAVADAVRDATRGDPVQALLKLDQIPAKQRRPSWHSVRAAILLTVGRVDMARAQLDAAAAADPGNADVAALRAVIALTKGDAVGARQALDRRSANSAAAWLAESYLRQNAGRLREALTATRRALELQPNNALLVAREAELLLTEGRLGKAVARAEQSLAMAGGDVSLGHIVLGFALLAERRPRPPRSPSIARSSWTRGTHYRDWGSDWPQSAKVGCRPVPRSSKSRWRWTRADRCSEAISARRTSSRIAMRWPPTN